MPAHDATLFVLFGATGDLSRRMVLPAFYQLFDRGLLPDRWHLVGNGRGDVAHEDFRADARRAMEDSGVELDDDDWSDFAAHLTFAGGGFQSADPGSLLDVISDSKAQLGEDTQYVHYLAIPPGAFETTTEALVAHNLLDGAKVVYEKPYGEDPDSFVRLDQLVQSVMDESQVYRIDHFLGKEATQNLHVLRFGNTMVGDIWNRRHIRQVQIDVPETLDVADRAEFYEATGAFRDMIVTHLFQVAAEVAMEPPVTMSAEDLVDAREAILAAFRPLDPSEAVFGQAEGYRDLPEVADDSTTETFAAVRLWIDTDRWRGVPFVLRSGKQLKSDDQRVSLVLNRPDGPLPELPGHGGVISFTLAGSGAIDLAMVIKTPGAELDLTQQNFALSLDEVAESSPLPPYVSLLHDIAVGDRSLFTSSDGLSRAWAAAQPLLESPPKTVPYEPGSWGPAAADALTGDLGWLTAPPASSTDEQ